MNRNSRSRRTPVQRLILACAVVASAGLAWGTSPSDCASVFDLRPSRAYAGKDDTKKKKEEPKRTVDAALVYYGRATAKWKTPAELDVDTVYAEIEEFKTLRKEGLEPTDARYSILMNKVSRKFQKALKKAAKNGGYDLVAALGAVKGVTDVPDISQAVIDEL